MIRWRYGSLDRVITNGISLYPTMMFIFREVNVSRKSQVKTRISVQTKDLTHQMLHELREKAEALAGLPYNHEIVRGNYISSDKRFKTTIYGQTNPETIHLFERILPVIEEPFQQNSLSYTFGPVTRRNNRIPGLRSNFSLIDYNLVFHYL